MDDTFWYTVLGTLAVIVYRVIHEDEDPVLASHVAAVILVSRQSLPASVRTSSRLPGVRAGTVTCTLYLDLG